MPYSKDELDNLPFYQTIAGRDEAKYIEMIREKTDSGQVVDGTLRNKTGDKILLFENIIPGQGTDESSHTVNHTIQWQEKYFKYERTEEINKIIKRDFTEF